MIAFLFVPFNILKLLQMLIFSESINCTGLHTLLHTHYNQPTKAFAGAEMLLKQDGCANRSCWLKLQKFSGLLAQSCKTF